MELSIFKKEINNIGINLADTVTLGLLLFQCGSQETYDLLKKDMTEKSEKRKEELAGLMKKTIKNN